MHATSIFISALFLHTDKMVYLHGPIELLAFMTVCRNYGSRLPHKCKMSAVSILYLICNNITLNKEQHVFRKYKTSFYYFFNSASVF